MNPRSLPARRVASLVLCAALGMLASACGRLLEDTPGSAPEGAAGSHASGEGGAAAAKPVLAAPGSTPDATPAPASVVQPAGVVIKPAGVVVQPAEVVVQPAEVVIQPAGVVIQPAGVVIQPAGVVKPVPLASVAGAQASPASPAGSGTGASDAAETRAAAQSRSVLVPPPEPPAGVSLEITRGEPVAVPADFVGLHINRWPSGDPVSAPPAYGYGTVRSLNYDPAGAGGVSWYDLNPARGVYDWARLDQWVQAHHAAGRRLVYTVYGTPAWASSRPGTADLYGMPGGDSRPADLADLRAFVTALVARYNGDGRRRLQLIETWNEPDLNGLPYWRDRPEDLAALARTVYQAAKAADPGITVLGPAWVDFAEDRSTGNKVRRFMAASDGAGGTGGQWMDAFAWHHYDYRFDIRDLAAHQAWARELLALAGRPGLPMHLTELGGWQWSAGKPAPAEQARQIQRWLMVAAAGGQRVAALYMHEVLAHLGDPSSHPAIGDAIHAAGQQLAGRTITRGALLADGSVWVAFADGSTMRR